MLNLIFISNISTFRRFLLESEEEEELPKKGRTAASKSATAEEISKRKRVHPDGKSGEEDGEEEEEPEEPKKGKKEVSR